MTEDRRDSLMRRIEKLMRLAESPNEHEAAAAAAKAQELLIENKLSMSDVERRSQDQANPLTETEYKIESKERWRHDLASNIASAYFCSTVHWSGRTAGSHRVAFLGRKADIEIAWFMYGYLAEKIETLAKVGYKAEYDRRVLTNDIRGALSMDTRKWTRAFKHGAQQTVSARLYENKKKHIDPEKSVSLDMTAPNTTGESRALILRNADQEVYEFKKKRHPKLGTMSRTAPVADSSGFHSGRKAGADIDLNVRGLKGNGGAKSVDRENKQGINDYTKESVVPRAQMLELD